MFDSAQIESDWSGVPYVADSRDRRVGLDCATLVYGIYDQAGHAIPGHISRRGEHGDRWMEGCLRVIRNCFSVVRDQRRTGDLLLMRIADRLHVGVVLEGDRVIHALPRKGTIVDPIVRWTANVIKVVRLKGL